MPMDPKDKAKLLKDWTPVAQGLGAVAVAVAVVYGTSDPNTLDVVLQPSRWDSGAKFKPFDIPGAQYGIVLATMMALTVVGRLVRIRDNKKQFLSYLGGLVATFFFALLGMFIAKAAVFDKNGITYEVFTLVIGMLLSNFWPRAVTMQSKTAEQPINVAALPQQAGTGGDAEASAGQAGGYGSNGSSPIVGAAGAPGAGVGGSASHAPLARESTVQQLVREHSLARHASSDADALHQQPSFASAVSRRSLSRADSQYRYAAPHHVVAASVVLSRNEARRALGDRDAATFTSGTDAHTAPLLRSGSSAASLGARGPAGLLAVTAPMMREASNRMALAPPDVHDEIDPDTTQDVQEELRVTTYSFKPLHAALSTSGEKGGEYYVKIALVLLSVKLQSLAKLGLPGFLVSWISTPLVMGITYLIGTRLLNVERTFMISMSGAVTICGASAATAISDVLSKRLDPGVTPAVIAILTVFTVPQVFILPTIARVAHMSSGVAGAWLGTTIDSTGFVVAAGSLLKDPTGARDAAAVKIIQNVLIAPVAVALSLLFEPTDPTKGEPVAAPKRSCMDLLGLLWGKLPKFVLGFIVASGVLTAIYSASESRGDATQFVVKSFSDLFFAFGFFHIGFATDLRELWSKLGSMAATDGAGSTSRAMPFILYGMIQTLDLLIKLLASFIGFQWA